MFLNQYDVVEHGGNNYVALSIEDSTVIILNVKTLECIEVLKSSCKRIAVMTDLRSSAVYASSLGKITKEVAKPTIMGVLSKCNWVDNASLNHEVNSWFYSTIEFMELGKTLSPGVLDEFLVTINKLKSGSRATVNIRGHYNGCELSVKLSLTKDGSIVSINNVKRIFGDNGLYGNIAKQTNSRKDRVPNTNVNKPTTNNKKSRAAA